MSHKNRYTLVILLCLLVLVGLFFSSRTSHVTNTTVTTKRTTALQNSFNDKQYSITDPQSIWVIVNKQHPLTPKTYVPNDLVTPTIPLRTNITSDESHVSAKIAPSLEKMVSDAKTQGILLNLQSGYRSYQLQVSVYANEVSNYGQTKADQESARPGYSEHQTGLAVDLGSISTPSCDVSQCFGSTKEGIWLAANAYKYGFIVRYTAGNQPLTGYEVEPWHIRYVGSSLSTEMHDKNITSLEQFFTITGGTTYN